MMDLRQMAVAGILISGLGFALGSGISLPEPPQLLGSCDDIGTSQELSEPCCPDHGVDACGALLFCATFDGRTQPTCYPEHSRADMTECFDHIQCVSGTCNQGKELCESSPSGSCDGEIGCAPDEQSWPHVCDPEDDVCRRIGDGEYGDLCLDDMDCDEVCDPETRRCKREAGSWPVCFEDSEPGYCEKFGMQACLGLTPSNFVCTVYCFGVGVDDCTAAGLDACCHKGEICAPQEYCD